MYVGLLNQRWGKLRKAHTIAICDTNRKIIAIARFWKNEEEVTTIAIKPKTSVVIIETDAPFHEPSYSEEELKGLGTCLSCGGPLVLKLFVRCLNADGSPSEGDTSKEPYCPRCGVFWESCEPFYPDMISYPEEGS